MKCLLIIAHGSRRQESNEEIACLTDKVSDIAANQFDCVTHAFLELGNPSISEGLLGLIHQKANKIHVLPYFLAAGRHVIEDIPQEVAKVKARFPEVDIVVQPHFGSTENIAKEVLLSSL